ncbi:MAG: cytochrome b558/566 subunit B [Sulfolobaceae archaeon]|nr:cytochrome b558/566 subunit B [Sulfolobaceae archaeon]
MEFRNYETLKISVFLLGLGVVIYLVFGEGIAYLSSLPVPIPHANILAVFSSFGFALEYFSLIVVSLVLSKLAKINYIYSGILIGSLLITLIPGYYSTTLWLGFTITTMFLGVVGLGEVTYLLIKNKRYLSTVLLSPTVALVLVLYYTAYSLIMHLPAVIISYKDFLLASVIGVLIYTILWGKIFSRRSIVAYTLSIVGFVIVLPLYFLVLKNRFLEIIMDMVIPSVTGVILFNPYSITILILTFGLILYTVLALAIKGNYYASIGYLALLVAGFNATSGFHFISLMIVPPIGYSLFLIKELQDKIKF